MALELKLQLKLQQQLVMTPQLQQAIKLLQLNRLELVNLVSQELQENPVLEEVEGGEELTPGELAENRTVVDLIKATFPGGSVTGAPKIRAMEIIDELEPVTRGIYTGSIGYIGFNGTADLNIAIRTMIVQDGSVYIHAGGGIVADSNEKEEYEESLLKARKLFQAVQRAGATVGAPN